MTTHAGALEALDRVLNRGGDADDVLRAAVDIVARRFEWAGILFREEGRLVLGPQAGAADEKRRTSVPVVFRGDPVAELAVDGDVDEEGRRFLDRVALLISAHCVVGWDTGGERWTP